MARFAFWSSRRSCGLLVAFAAVQLLCFVLPGADASASMIDRSDTYYEPSSTRMRGRTSRSANSGSSFCCFGLFNTFKFLFAGYLAGFLVTLLVDSVTSGLSTSVMPEHFARVKLEGGSKVVSSELLGPFRVGQSPNYTHNQLVLTTQSPQKEETITLIYAINPDLYLAMGLDYAAKLSPFSIWDLLSMTGKGLSDTLNMYARIYADFVESANEADAEVKKTTKTGNAKKGDVSERSRRQHKRKQVKVDDYDEDDAFNSVDFDTD